MIWYTFGNGKFSSKCLYYSNLIDIHGPVIAISGRMPRSPDGGYGVTTRTCAFRLERGEDNADLKGS